MNFFIGLACLAVTVAAGQTKSDLQFLNESDDYFSAHWVNPKTEATVLIKDDIEPRTAFTLNSYLSHRFELRQEPDPETGICGRVDDKECKINYFQVTESPVQGELS